MHQIKKEDKGMGKRKILITCAKGIPLCGSGTLAIEAALITLNRAPGLLRGNYGFMHLKGFNEPLWNELRSEAKKVGLRAKRRIPFFNSRIECRLLEYELYEGSRKKKYDGGIKEITHRRELYGWDQTHRYKTGITCFNCAEKRPADRETH